jgi:hypothetical protein
MLTQGVTAIKSHINHQQQQAAADENAGKNLKRKISSGYAALTHTTSTQQNETKFAHKK